MIWTRLKQTKTTLYHPKFRNCKTVTRGFPDGSAVRNLLANARDLGSTPGSGRSPGGGMATHSRILALKIPWRSLAGYSPRGCKSRTGLSDWTGTCTSISSIFLSVWWKRKLSTRSHIICLRSTVLEPGLNSIVAPLLLLLTTPPYQLSILRILKTHFILV